MNCKPALEFISREASELLSIYSVMYVFSNAKLLNNTLYQIILRGIVCSDAATLGIVRMRNFRQRWLGGRENLTPRGVLLHRFGHRRSIHN
jgi:hypothetical protein